MARAWCNLSVVITSDGVGGIPARVAAERAGITYRQLDHWATRGWVQPSIQASTGRGVRRLYAVDDVLRLAALRHFGQSGWLVNELGEQVAACQLAGARWLVAGTRSGVVIVADEDQLHGVLGRREQFSVFALDELRDRLAGGPPHEQAVGLVEPVELRRLA
jgi:DNA-binding transcriptional MerR regulator